MPSYDEYGRRVRGNKGTKRAIVVIDEKEQSIVGIAVVPETQLYASLLTIVHANKHNHKVEALMIESLDGLCDYLKSEE